MSALDEKNMDSLLTLEEVLSAVGGELLSGSGNDFSFTSVATDSRNVKEGTLFVPLIGEFQDGHLYIPKAIENGASVIFVSKKDDDILTLVLKNPLVSFILVKNTLTALQNSAEKYVSKFPKLIKVSVTGSSGKTTTKELLTSILKQKYNVISNVGNLNSETGLPLSVFNIRPEHELGLFEMGMNRENEIGEISKVFKPNYGVITNIGTAHIGLLGNRENIAREKKKIFDHVDSKGVCVIPKNDDFEEFLAKDLKGKVVFYGNGVNPRIKFISDEGLFGTAFSLDGLEIKLALPGKYNFSNALGAISLSLELGLTPQQIKAGVEGLSSLNGRSEIVKKHGFTVLKDCYNANPDSMEKALELCSCVEFKGKKILVIGDMLELGEESKSAHEKAGVLACESKSDLLVFIGNEMKYGFEKTKTLSSDAEIRFVSGRDDSSIEEAVNIISDFCKGSENENFLLLKGSRGMGLERILERL